MDQLAELQNRLKPNRDGMLRKVSERILGLEKMRIWFASMTAVGVAAAGIGKMISGTPDVVTVIVGVVLAFVGTLLLARFDFRKLELTAEVVEAENIAEEAIEIGRTLETVMERLKVEGEIVDRKRLALRQVNDITREVAEQAAFAEVAEFRAAARLMLELASIPIGTSIGFQQDERWAISIFRIEKNDQEELLRRVTGIRADRLQEQANAREWRLNEGLVGTVWATKRDAIIEDYRDARVPQDYPMPDELKRNYDVDRYRSMAGVPIIVGPERAIWGVVAASSDVTGRFTRDPDNTKTQAVDTIRSLSRASALLAAIFEVRR